MGGRPAPAGRDSSPLDENTNSTMEWATATTQAPTGDIGISREPTVSMTRLE